MKMNAPKTTTWIISVVLGVAGILMYTGTLNVPVEIRPIWFVTAGFGLLAVAALFKGL